MLPKALSSALIASLIGSSLLTGCAGQTLTSTWTAPEVWSLNPRGKTIAVALVSPNESTRRDGENALAEDLSARNAHGVVGYTLLPNERLAKGEAALAELKQAGVNGVVVMRVVGKHESIRLYGSGLYGSGYVLPASYSGFARYWDYGWGSLHEPRDLQSNAPLEVETLVYSLDQGGKAVWASNSRSIDPRDLDTLIREVAAEIAREMFSSPPSPFFAYEPEDVMR